MRFPCRTLALGALALSLVTTSQAALITSFSDDFDREDLGDNYTTAGGAFIITDNTLQNFGGGTLLYNGGTLPTAADYASGFSFTASVDIFIGDPAPVILGLALNYQSSGPVSYQLISRGNEPDGTLNQIWLNWRDGDASGNHGYVDPGITASLNTWYTLTVTSTAQGTYAWTFAERGGSPVLTGTYTQDPAHPSDGGSIGFFADNGSGYQWDNFSVSVSVPEPATIGLALGAIGALGFVGCRRRKAKSA